MLNRTIQLLLFAGLVTSSSWAADDPFVGKWKVNASRSTLTDEFKVEASGPNTIKLTFTGVPGETETIVANGTAQPGLGGTLLSVTVKGPNTWEVVRKMKGRTLLRAIWTLSEDGKMLNDAFTQYLPDGTTLFSEPLPDGSTLFLPYVYERTAGNSGLLGTWDSESARVSARLELRIQRAEDDGLSFKRSDEETARKIELDGNDHPGLGGSEGAAYSGRRVNERILEITDKIKGNISGTRRIELSPDLKTLTMTERLANQSKPKSVLVFDRE
ncbi:MAG: hypothetical protein ACRD16_08335 [Thermoanaerobaculia bacterium]